MKFEFKTLLKLNKNKATKYPLEYEKFNVKKTFITVTLDKNKFFANEY